VLRVLNKFEHSIIWRAASLFDKKDQLKIIAVVLVQITLSFLDLLGVALIGLLGALGVIGIQSRQPEGTLNQVLSVIGIAEMNFQTQALVLGVLSTSILILRTILSVIFTKRILYFLGRRAAAISEKAIHALFRKQLAVIQFNSSQETVFALTHGITSLTLGVVGTAVAIVVDGSLLLVIGIGLLVIDPVMALGTALLFSAAAALLNYLMHKRALTLGIEQAEINIKSNQILLESLSAYRDIYVRNGLTRSANEFSQQRFQLSNNIAESTFMPFVSKYVIEALILFGALTLSAIQFILRDAESAISTLALFMAAGTRLAPAVLRIQQSLIAIKSSSGNAQKSIELIDTLDLTFAEDPSMDIQFASVHTGFNPSIQMKNVSARYPKSDKLVLKSISLQISPGEFVAFVGSSGSGKSTLVDVILGVLLPETGTVKVSGTNPADAIARWPGAIGYVPQEVYIKDGSISENISLGFGIENVPEFALRQAVSRAQLSEMVGQYPDHLNAVVGEGGSMLSGGQKQRLGIARALVTSPELLILDEATSALDGKTESEITEAITSLKGLCTVIVVAHRLSTIRGADKVVYLDEGSILAIGTFDEVRKQIPEFNLQAKSMGL
jgi:ABC-type multidrug transport system fused ATPase/permease subunit